MKRRVGIAGIAVLLMAVAAAAGTKFRALPDPAPFGTYRVTLSPDTLGEGEELVERLVQVCRCRRQPFAQLGFHGFVVTASESAARLLSLDPRVVLVEGVAASVATPGKPQVADQRPTPAAPADVATTAQPIAASSRPPRSPGTDADAVPWSTGPYTYDGSGNVTGIGPNLFRYDQHGRVTRADAEGHTQRFTYDRYGNLTSVTTDGNTAAAVILNPSPATNRLTNAAGSSANTTYDAAGRMTSMTTASFVYDSLDSVVESTIDGVRRIHLYSASDERIATFAVVGNAIAGSDWTLRDPAGKVLRRLTRSASGQWTWNEDYIYRDGQLLAAEVATPDRTLHFHPDHLGTPRLITNHAGAKVALHTYHAFGTEATNAAQDTERLKYTGHERDIAYLDYMHARYYTPRWGRFLSVDPVLDIEEALHEPQLWNRYSYVTNNPLKFTDDDGRYRTFYKEKSLREADVANAPPLIKAAFMIQGGLLLGAPAAEGGIAALGALGRAAFTTFPRVFLSMMGMGAGITGAPSGPIVNLGSGGRPIPGAVNVDSMGDGFQGIMRQIQVAGDVLALPFKSGSVGNVTAQNLPGQLLGQGGQKLAGELARTMHSGSTLKITTQTAGALQNFAKLLEKTYKDVVIKDNMLTAVRR